MQSPLPLWGTPFLLRRRCDIILLKRAGGSSWGTLSPESAGSRRFPSPWAKSLRGSFSRKKQRADANQRPGPGGAAAGGGCAACLRALPAPEVIRLIYLDNSSTTQPCAETVEKVTELLTKTWGNPSSLHSLGLAAEQEVGRARGPCRALGCTPGGNLFYLRRHRGRQPGPVRRGLCQKKAGQPHCHHPHRAPGGASHGRGPGAGRVYRDLAFPRRQAAFPPPRCGRRSTPTPFWSA